MILTLLILLTLNPASDSTAWHLWEKADSLYRNERFGEAVSTAAGAPITYTPVDTDDHLNTFFVVAKALLEKLL